MNDPAFRQWVETQDLVSETLYSFHPRFICPFCRSTLYPSATGLQYYIRNGFPRCCGNSMDIKTSARPPEAEPITTN